MPGMAEPPGTDGCRPIGAFTSGNRRTICDIDQRATAELSGLTETI
jgi:hypothetical protein